MSDKNKILDFIPKKEKTRKNTDESEKGVAETGNFGRQLKYKVFKRGNLHIFDEKKKLTFKKDCCAFETEIEDMDLDNLTEGQSKNIKGCGDNDTLVFTCYQGDIKISLERRRYAMLTRLKKLLSKGK